MLFLAVIFYFFRYNRFHLFYLEQTQLFTWDPRSLAVYFTAPGGFARLTGAFVTQFFASPLAAALLVTVLIFCVYLLSASILTRAGMHGIIFPMIPTVILAGLHSSHMYIPAHTVAWILVLLYVYAYGKIHLPVLRILFGIAGWIVLYIFAGFYAFTAFFILPFTQLHSGRKEITGIFVTGIVLIAAIPMLAGRFLFLLPYADRWLSPANELIHGELKWQLWSLLLYLPLLLGINHIRVMSRLINPKGWKAWLAGILVMAIAVPLSVKHTYDFRNEVFLRIDYAVQHEQWDDVLKQSRRYPGSNRLVMYYSNLALYKTGRLADDFFTYPQSGTSGLWLSWQRNETAPFFGGEIFYELAYNNEAFRWAFEAMEAKGPNPRCLKRLAITSIVNGDNELAKKYLHFLEETLMYRNWARHYMAFVNDPSLVEKDGNMRWRRSMLIQHDFISDINEYDPGLVNLLENHPENRMAFEYRMLTLLLHKDLPAFTAQIGRLKELGYSRIPGLFEEAVLLYAGMNREFQLPDGFVISAETRDRFRSYATVFTANRQSIPLAEAALRRNFGHTFWYYMQFADPTKANPGEKL
jgi:hypothetical protein